MVKLSERLTSLARMVSCGGTLADVGTDHGYVPIYLMENGQMERAIAMDIGKGPLLRAKEHIRLYGMEDVIETRLSDGVEALEVGEADSILIAGMGGNLILHILESGKDVVNSAKELILQPQSEIDKVRRYLYEHQLVIDQEKMLVEDGKYYTMFHITVGQKEDVNMNALTNEEREVCLHFGYHLLMGADPVLYEYLNKTKLQLEQILSQLEEQEQTIAIETRKEQIKKEYSLIQYAMSIWHKQEEPKSLL